MTDSGASVEITETGRGGGILYREDRLAVRFSWEYALSPALVLVFGPPARGWDGTRQAEIYDFVAAEIVRQRAPGRAWEIDLEAGIITILERASARAPARAEPDPVAPPPALDDRLSIDARLAAAETMHGQGRLADLDRFIARELRRLDRPQDGMERALRLAAEHPSERVRQALLWASWNTTDCAPHCAAVLLALSGAAQGPADDAMLAKLGLHNSSYDREAAFAALCSRVQMKLDPDATE